MRFSRVLLIYPAHYRRYDPFLPIGLGYIAQALSDAHINYEIIDMALGYNMRSLKRRIDSFQPDLIGVSMMTLSYKKVYKFIEQIKKKYPLLKIVVGGPHLSTLREKVLEECPSIDYGMVLQGEETMVELCEGAALEDIKGLIYRENEKILFNGIRIAQKEISFPQYEKFELKKYWFAEDVPMPISTSRGCPCQCTFCIAKISGGSRFYARSANSVVDEIEYWHKRGRFIFDILDDNFSLDSQRVYSICEEITRRGLDKLRYQCINGVRADRVNRDLLNKMREVGFKRLAFGVESASDKILQILKKQETVSQIEEAIKTACELGYEVILFFLVGLPFETWDDLEVSVNLALRYPIYQARFFNIIPIPNTELFDWVKQKNLFIYPPERYLNFSQADDRRPVFVTKELPYRKRKNALRYTRSIEEKVRRRYYQRILYHYGIWANLMSAIAANSFVAFSSTKIAFIKKFLRLIKHILIFKDEKNATNQ